MKIYEDTAEFCDECLGLKTSGNLVFFDFGIKKVGVAVGSLELKIASELKNINKNLENELADIIKTLNPIAFITGYVFEYESGQGSFLNPYILQFCELLLEISEKTIPVLLYDENLSSKQVFAYSSSMGIKTGKKFKKTYDKTVATYLLQQFLNELNFFI